MAGAGKRRRGQSRARSEQLGRRAALSAADRPSWPRSEGRHLGATRLSGSANPAPPTARLAACSGPAASDACSGLRLSVGSRCAAEPGSALPPRALPGPRAHCVFCFSSSPRLSAVPGLQRLVHVLLSKSLTPCPTAQTLRWVPVRGGGAAVACLGSRGEGRRLEPGALSQWAPLGLSTHRQLPSRSGVFCFPPLKSGGSPFAEPSVLWEVGRACGKATRAGL